MFWIIIFCLLYMLQIYSLILSFAFILISLILMILSGIQLSALFWVLSVYVNFYFYYWNLNLFLFWMNYLYIKTTYHLLSVLLQVSSIVFCLRWLWSNCFIDKCVCLFLWGISHWVEASKVYHYLYQSFKQSLCLLFISIQIPLIYIYLVPYWVPALLWSSR